MKGFKDSLLVLTSAIALNGCAFTKYYANLDESYTCGRDGSKDFEMYKGKELVARKVPNEHFNDRVYEFFDNGKKTGVFKVMPGYSYEWEPEQKSPSTLDKALELYKIIRKCEDSLRDKYQKEFDDFEEH